MEQYPRPLTQNLLLNWIPGTCYAHEKVKKHGFKDALELLREIRAVWSYEVFPHCSVGKEYTCNAGDTGSIPGSERSTGEGIGYPLQYSWASFVAQLVKNLPAMLETWVQSLGWEDSMQKGKATHSSILACIVHGVSQSQTRLSNFHFHFEVLKLVGFYR